MQLLSTDKFSKMNYPEKGIIDFENEQHVFNFSYLCV